MTNKIKVKYFFVMILSAIILNCCTTSDSDDNTPQLKSSTDSNDLLYKNYGNDVIEADINTTFILTNVDSILESYEIEGIYALNRTTSTLYKISSDKVDIEYRIEENGFYEIFAQTTDEEEINLNQYITIEVDSPKSDNIISPLKWVKILL